MPDWPRLTTQGIQQGDNLDRNAFLKRKAETRRKIVEARAEAQREKLETARALPDRSFADQIEALRRLTNRQIAVLEMEEGAGGMLDSRQFKALQSLAFVVRSLSAEARAASQNWDPGAASDDELASITEGSGG